LSFSVSGDRRLFNQYSVMVVNPALHPLVKSELGEEFANWLTSVAGQSAIGGYRIGGEQVFFSNAPTHLSLDRGGHGISQKPQNPKLVLQMQQ
jgi:ABC-type tungstate transport system permease subunit